MELCQKFLFEVTSLASECKSYHTSYNNKRKKNKTKTNKNKQNKQNKTKTVTIRATENVNCSAVFLRQAK